MTVLEKREVMNEGLDSVRQRVEKVKKEILDLNSRLEILNCGDHEIIECCARALQREARQ
jgi:hypothetical protein